jgi:hypothetical protein
VEAYASHPERSRRQCGTTSFGLTTATKSGTIEFTIEPVILSLVTEAEPRSKAPASSYSISSKVTQPRKIPHYSLPFRPRMLLPILSPLPGRIKCYICSVPLCYTPWYASCLSFSMLLQELVVSLRYLLPCIYYPNEPVVHLRNLKPLYKFR